MSHRCRRRRVLVVGSRHQAPRRRFARGEKADEKELKKRVRRFSRYVGSVVGGGGGDGDGGGGGAPFVLYARRRRRRALSHLIGRDTPSQQQSRRSRCRALFLQASPPRQLARSQQTSGDVRKCFTMLSYSNFFNRKKSTYCLTSILQQQTWLRTRRLRRSKMRAFIAKARFLPLPLVRAHDA